MKQIKDFRKDLIKIRDSRHTKNSDLRTFSDALLTLEREFEALEEVVHKINSTVQEQIKFLKERM